MKWLHSELAALFTPEQTEALHDYLASLRTHAEQAGEHH